MLYYTLPPSPELSPYVRFFWVLESEASVNQPYVHRSMADGCAELIFHYRGQFTELVGADKTEKSFMAGLHGPAQTFRRFAIQQSFGIFGVYLYPFALTQFFSIPAVEVRNQMPHLSSLLGREGSNLEDKIMTAPDNSTRWQLLSQFLLKKLINNRFKQPPPVFATIQSIIQNKGILSVNQLAEQTCLSTRQFERAFKSYSGFSPKLFSRIIRFQAALNEYGNQQKSLTEISYTCGYYDQSHFIHDFKEFSGHHPRVYFSGKSLESAYRDC
ncbi:helix-turn-helix transcriptional regulator [Adhaeribacter radiodurans]|uniref:Helix-turn-helix transcriptional regulator n=1 Tax=Adhaeribacter radiodurans TaxID=2745197 RepID=A0A7L7L3L6_9BACT|nr:helix-turn-helix transcriptional regulator [Adhaeribacter radiodurans]QMU27412.1 helix-turn-helix transcriptional regulator [Adhaeribacter radiodurans]